MKAVYLRYAARPWLALCLLFSLNVYSQQTLTTINGWNAYVHLPDDYGSTGTKTYPLIVFFPGVGEVGTYAPAVLNYGPGNFIASGWNGNVTLNGTTYKPIIISLQPPSSYPPVASTDIQLEAIKKLYRVDPTRISLTGLSQGGWMAEMYAMAYPTKIANVVALTAVKPDDNPAYPAPFATFAKDCGHYLGYEQINDFRDMATIANTMNAAVPGSAQYIQTNVGGGGHCCWNTWYDPTNTQSYKLNGTSGNWTIYQYMMAYAGCSTGSTPPVTQVPPTVSAGNSQTITMPSGGSTQTTTVSFNFSNSPVAISGWTNMAGQPGNQVITATSGGIKLSSVATANWAPYSGATSYDGGGVNAPGFFNNASVSVNNWHQYGDPTATYNVSKPQLQATGLSSGASYTVKMSGSNAFNLDANPCSYTIIGASTYGPISVNLNGTADNGATFNGVVPDASGSIRIYVNTVANTSQLAQINGLQISWASGTTTAAAAATTTTSTASVNLNGSASGNNGATIKSTTWSQVGGGATTIASPSSLSTSVSGLQPGTYTYQLTGTDNNGLSSSSTTTITVNSAASTATPPTVSAGSAQTITLSPAVSQSASFNFSNSPVSVSGWTNMAGQPGNQVITGTSGGVRLSSVATANWAPYSGATSYDGGGVNAAGFFNNAAVSVNNWHQYGDPAATYNVSKPQLQASGLTAGASYTVKMSGSNAFNLDANPCAYTIVGASTYGPISVNLNGTASNGATFSGVIPDASGSIKIYVNSVANTSQLAQINGLQISSTSGSQPGTVTLTGTASGTGGATIKSTTWSQIGGGATTIASPSSLSTAVSGLQPGTYTYKLTATDNNGLSSSSTVTITVNGSGSTSTTPPTVTASSAPSITLPVSSVTLNGTASGNGGATIKSTSWTQVSGPATSTILNANTLTASATGLTAAGSYVFRLTATDNNGLSSSATATMTVNPGASGATAPTVTASSAPSITLPVSSVTLNGTATGTGGATIKSIAWTQVSGPATSTILNANTLTASATGLTAAGSYVFKMTATDNNGLSSSASVTMTVNAATGSTSGCGCDITLQPGASDGQVYVDGQTLGVKPGMKVCLKAGHYVSIGLFHFYGTPSQPVTIINCGGLVNVSGYVGYGFALHSSRYVRVTGTGDPNTKYGILMDGSVAGTTVGYAEDAQCSDIEVDHLEISKTAGFGVACCPTPNCDPSTWSTAWKMYNMSFHDMYVHETLDEGFYIGNTQNDYVMTCSGSTVTVHPQQIDTLRFYNNIIDKAGWTAAQISQVTGYLDCHDNLITNFGYANQTQHQAGIIVGALTHGRVYRNKVLNGTGSALQVFGAGESFIYNNIFANAGYDGTLYGQNAVMMDDRPIPAGTVGQKVNLVNNTIINPRRNGISYYDDYGSVVSGGIIANNLITQPGFLPSPVAYIDLQNSVPVTVSNNLSLATTDLAKFVNAAGGDYHLLSGSPAINTGMNTSAYGVTTDMDGNARPSGGTFDIGAYEFTGTTAAAASMRTFGSAAALTDSLDAGISESLNVYPNPARDVVNINWSSSYTGSVTFSLLDATGRLMKMGNFTKTQVSYYEQLSVQSLSPGVYILVFKMQNGRTLTQRVLKQ